MAKTINRLALQQSLVRNGVAEDPAAGNVADDFGDEIDAVTADLATKDDLAQAVAQINHRLREEISGLRLLMETWDRKRAERESEWRAEQQEREDKWRAEQQKRDEAREKRDEEWRKEQRERDAAQRKRDDEARQREVAAAKTTSRLLWAIFGSTVTLGGVIGIVAAVT